MRSIKLTILVLALLLAACNKYDIQPEQAEGFIKFYSSTLTEMGYDVKETSDGGYVAIGTTSDEEGLRNIYLVKTDKYGNEESWSPAIIGGDFDDVATSIQLESDGYVILGYSKQSDTTEYDMYLVKTDLQGNVSWEKRQGDASDTDGSIDDRGLSLQITSSGEYLAAGIRRNTTFDTYDYRIVRFATDGTVMKDRVISSSDPNATVSTVFIIEVQSHFILCSTITYLQKKEILIIPVFKDSHFPDGGKRFTSTGDLYGNCIQELSDGNLLVCGTNVNAQSGLGDIYLNKISASLGTVSGWETPKLFAEEEGDQASLTGNSVRIINDNSYAIVGTRTETGNDDIILLHTDAAGSEVSRQVFGDEGFQQGMSLEVTVDGGLILIGNNGAEDNSMFALVRTNAEGKL